MFSYEEIRKVHLELTDKCNAACPQCSRSERGGPVNPLLPLTELNLDDIKTIFPPSFVSQLVDIYACGNFGDPIVAGDCLEIFRYFRDCSPKIHLSIHTNGGVRSADFWRQLGGIMTGGAGYVRFGIDGLEDTNHIYRRNVRWPVLMRNVKAFIEGGGNAQLDYLVFRHNQHQVDDARRMAEELGFNAFNPKKSGRFVDFQKMVYVDSTKVFDKDRNTVGYIERPTDPQWQNDALETLKVLQDRYGNMAAYYDQTRVSCKVKQRRAIFVSAEGFIFPCCWLGGHLYPRVGAQQSPELGLLDSVGGTDHIDALKRSIKDIIEDSYFRELVPGSWEKPSVAEGKLYTCARICGDEFNQIDAEKRTIRPAAARHDRLDRHSVKVLEGLLAN